MASPEHERGEHIRLKLKVAMELYIEEALRLCVLAPQISAVAAATSKRSSPFRSART